jgi:NitT/TauT family transport system permease protein
MSAKAEIGRPQVVATPTPPQRSTTLLRRLRANSWPLLGAVALFSLWELMTRVLTIPAYLVPAPSSILSALVDQRTLLLRNSQITIIETLAGFFIGSLFSIAFGLLVVFWAPAKKLFMPYMVVIQTMPKVALAPLFVIWFGFGLMTNIIFTSLIAFFPVLVNFVQGLEDVSQSEQRLMASYNASRLQMFRHVHLYRSLPYLFAGLKMSAVLAVIGAVVSEFVAGDGGLGYYMVQAQSRLKTADAFAALTVLTLLGLGFYAIVDAIHRVATPWAPDDVGETNVV